MLTLVHIGLVVKNCAHSRDFYCQVLGCTLENSWENQDLKAIELRSGNLIIELLEYRSPQEQNRNQGIYDHLAFSVDNMEDCLQQLKKLGVEFESAAPRQLVNGKKIIFFRGPDKERIELVEEPLP